MGKVRCKLHGVSYIVSKRHELWSTNGLKLDCSFYPFSVNPHSTSFPGFTDADQQTELKQTSPNGGRWIAPTTCRRKFGVVPPENSGAKKLLHLFVFSTTSTCNGEYLLNEDNRARALKSAKGLLRCPKISWTSFPERLKTGLEFLPAFTILVCPSPSHTLYATLTWHPTATLNETALGSSAAQIWSPKRC